MNHKTMIRFKIVENGHILETSFDDRLSFKENLTILSDICEEQISNARIYDPIKKIFLNEDVPLSLFSFQYFVFLYLFT